MQDIEILLENKPGALALMGETLGKNNISLEGGGVYQMGKNQLLISWWKKQRKPEKN